MGNKFSRLDIDIGANLAPLRRDMEAAKQIVRRSDRDIKRSISGVKVPAAEVLGSSGLRETIALTDRLLRTVNQLALGVKSTGESAQRTSGQLQTLAAKLQGLTKAQKAVAVQNAASKRTAPPDEDPEPQKKDSTIQKTLESWLDTKDSLEALYQGTLNNIKSSLSTFFEGVFSGGEDAWQKLWDSFRSIAKNALAQVATIMAKRLVANIVLYIESNGSGGKSDLFGSSSSLFGGSESDLFGSLISQSGGRRDPGDASVAADFAGINAEITESSRITEASRITKASQGAAGAGSMAMGTAAALGGVGGSLVGGLIADNELGSELGGIGGAAGAMIGMSVGGPIGALVGGLIGAGAGGLAGSLFGDEPEEWEIPGNYKAHLERLEEVLEQFSESVEDGTFRNMKFERGLDSLGITLSEMAPLIAGTGELMGNYGYVVGGTLQKLAQMTVGTKEYAQVVATELNPAWIISEGLTREIADDMDVLEAHKRALTSSIDALLSPMTQEGEQTQQLIDLLLKHSDSVETITAQYGRLEEIKSELATAHELNGEELNALIAEGRDLRTELGLEDTAMGNMVSVTNDLKDSIFKLAEAIKALPTSKTIDIGINQHSMDGIMYGSYGRGWPRAHGGAWMGLRPDEVPIVAQTGERVLSREEVATIGGQAAVDNLARQGAGAGGSGDMHITINVSGAGDPEAVARKTVRALEQNLGGVMSRGRTALNFAQAPGLV